MERICLDTQIALDFLCGEKNVVEKLRYYADREEICITTLTLFQLFRNIRKKEVASSFINNLSILPFDKKAAVIATQITAERDSFRMTQELETILTASVCMANNAFLFTEDRKKFDGIKGLKLV